MERFRWLTLTRLRRRTRGRLQEDPTSTLLSKGFLVLLAIIAAVVGVLRLLAAWCFVELIYQIQRELYTHLPNALGYHNGPPILVVASDFGDRRVDRRVRDHCPGDGGHVAAEGLQGRWRPDRPDDRSRRRCWPALASIGMGAVIGPEAPLIALGGGLAVATVKLARKEAPSQVLVVVAATGSFAALSFVFGSPASRRRRRRGDRPGASQGFQSCCSPGSLAPGSGRWCRIGMGAFTGLSSSAYALGSAGAARLSPSDSRRLRGGRSRWRFLVAFVELI